ncbi:MAG: ATP-binding protein [Candidatus Nanopelagicaceae bacterium]
MINVNWWTVGLLIVSSLGWLIAGLRNRFLKQVVSDLQWRNVELTDDLKVGLKNYQLVERQIFLAIIHNLKNTFLGIKMVTNGEMSPGTMRQSLDNIGLTATDALHQTKSILNNSFHKTDGDKLPVMISARFSPLVTLQKISKKFQQDINYSQHNIRIELAKRAGNRIQDRLANFRGNEDLLRSIFENLITNACEATKLCDSKNKNVSILIDLIIKESEEWLKFSIINEGRIPQELVDNFLKKPVISTKKSGSGVGSYIAAVLTRSMRGKIYLHINDSNCVDIAIEIPTIASLEH